MKQPIIVTNIRMPKEDWKQMKAIASELGMSLNEYMTISGKIVSTYRTLFGYSKKSHDPYRAMWNIIRKKSTSKSQGLSQEDEAIYAV